MTLIVSIQRVDQVRHGLCVAMASRHTSPHAVALQTQEWQQMFRASPRELKALITTLENGRQQMQGAGAASAQLIKVGVLAMGNHRLLSDLSVPANSYFLMTCSIKNGFSIYDQNKIP